MCISENVWTPLCIKVALCLIARPSHNSGRCRNLKRGSSAVATPSGLACVVYTYNCESENGVSGEPSDQPLSATAQGDVEIHGKLK